MTVLHDMYWYAEKFEKSVYLCTVFILKVLLLRLELIGRIWGFAFSILWIVQKTKYISNLDKSEQFGLAVKSLQT